MKTVVDPQICAWLARNGYFYVMHRFDLDNLQFVRDMAAHCAESFTELLQLAAASDAEAPAEAAQPAPRATRARRSATPVKRKQASGKTPQRPPARKSARARVAA
jgi:hypothetical protein